MDSDGAFPVRDLALQNLELVHCFRRDGRYYRDDRPDCHYRYFAHHDTGCNGRSGKRHYPQCHYRPLPRADFIPVLLRRPGHAVRTGLHY